MPQLDFVWWIVNFFLVWTAILVVLTILVSNETPSNVDQLSSSPKIAKNTAEWQWL
uniref:ATP synthase complex subunit 8 n=1 Tax=Mellita quinquiesperforata TaxID=1351942 RepID=A0A290YWP6_9ECHN|nr:ATP synthase protein 8 [Mellita quinquiesperforata]ATE50449.1 ATP synthase protein 8 [Mellita quinquiesperforata]ATE50450.1 ATP synthase protein 8 [Mellita quinquiesperforata]ATE50451.1 ATP synthase protein 8 [Mellita quinquiesperforata]ATE50452.1 ATP synthase protein 8 [Mellita quinquiesperforata]